MKQQFHKLLAILLHYPMGRSSEHFFSTVHKFFLFTEMFTFHIFYFETFFIAELEALLALRAISLYTVVYEKIAYNTHGSKRPSSNGS